MLSCGVLLEVDQTRLDYAPVADRCFSEHKTSSYRKSASPALSYEHVRRDDEMYEGMHPTGYSTASRTNRVGR